MGRLYDALMSSFGSDYRSLAAMRILLGAIVFSDCILRLQYVTEFHGRFGLMPPEKFKHDGFQLTLHRVSHDPRVHFAMCLVGAAGAAGMVLGYHTRVCALVSWLHFHSACNHNFEIVQGGDRLAVALSLMCVFLPNYECWSVDSALFELQRRRMRRRQWLGRRGEEENTMLKVRTELSEVGAEHQLGLSKSQRQADAAVDKKQMEETIAAKDAALAQLQAERDAEHKKQMEDTIVAKSSALAELQAEKEAEYKKEEREEGRHHSRRALQQEQRPASGKPSRPGTAVRVRTRRSLRGWYVRPGPSVLDAATFFLTVQMCTLYWCNSLHKTDPIWWTEGSAVWYALSLDQFCTHLGRLLLQFPPLLTVLTHFAIRFEAYGPFVALLPLAPARLLACTAGIGFHLGLFFTMELGPFPFVCVAMWLGLLPPLFWDWAVPAQLQPSFCGGGDNGDGDAEQMGGEQVQHAQQAQVQSRGPSGAASAAVLSSTLFQAANELMDVAALAAAATDLAAAVRDIYSTPTPPATDKEADEDEATATATRQYFHRVGQFHRVASSPVWPALLYSLRTVFLLTTAYASTVWALREAKFLTDWPQGASYGLDWLARGTGTSARWAMFAPRPTTVSGWFVSPGQLNDGSEVNLFAQGGPVDRDAILGMGAAGLVPADPSVRPGENYCVNQFRQERWRKYIMNVGIKRRADIQLLYGKYLCRKWNHLSRDGWFPTGGLTHSWNATRSEEWVKRHDPKGLKTFQLWFYRQRLNYSLHVEQGVQQKTEPIKLWSHECWAPEKDGEPLFYNAASAAPEEEELQDEAQSHAQEEL